MPALPEPLRKKLLALSGAGALALAACYTAFWEGHATRPYADSGGVLTVCYGHTGGDITPGTTRTPAQCEALLAADMRQAFAVIDQQVTVPLSDGQRVALAAFIHNVGAGAFGSVNACGKPRSVPCVKSVMPPGRRSPSSGRRSRSFIPWSRPLSMKNSNSAEKVKKAASKCASGYRGSIAPVSLCLALWLTGCAATRVKVVTLPPVPLPEGLLAACPAPLPPEPLTFGANVEYSLQLLAVIKQCNADKAALRQAEHYRQEQTHDE